MNLDHFLSETILSETTGVVSKGHKPNVKMFPEATEETIRASKKIKRLQYINYTKNP